VCGIPLLEDWSDPGGLPGHLSSAEGGMSCDNPSRDDIPGMEVSTIVKALRQHLSGTHDYALHCPRAAPTTGVVICIYHHWFSLLASVGGPVSGRRMQRFLQIRLGSHKLPVVLGRFAEGQHVARASRVCTHCGGVAVADESHMPFECPVLYTLR